VDYPALQDYALIGMEFNVGGAGGGVATPEPGTLLLTTACVLFLWRARRWTGSIRRRRWQG
jgi:hypothetical protein